jgi:DNA modification methylase
VKTETIRLGKHAKVGVHPAKMHPDLARTLVLDYSDPGDLVLDPFAGCGTTLWACAETGRRGFGVEVEEDHAAKALTRGPCSIGDARDLPFAEGTFDLVLTSPPYGEAIGRSGDRAPAKTAAAKVRYEKKRFGKVVSKHAVYGTSPLNIGTVPLRRFKELMPAAIKHAVRVVKRGGFVVLVVKDQRLGRRRLGSFDLAGSVVRWGEDSGAVFYGRRFGIIPESSWTLWQRVNEKRWDIPVPDVEQVIVLRRSV